MFRRCPAHGPIRNEKKDLAERIFEDSESLTFPAMSSFFTLPASQRKRKREDPNAVRVSKKRGVAINDGKRDNIQRRKQEEDQSISGSDSDDDENVAESVGVESGDESSSGLDEAETAADRRRKLAERYLDNIREEVDEVGFDAAEIDRDLIAERLKEDVVCKLSMFYWSHIDQSSST